jgi:hypothetical protein
MSGLNQHSSTDAATSNKSKASQYRVNVGQGTNCTSDAFIAATS